MGVYLNIIQLIISAALIALTVMQSRSAGLGRMFGSDNWITTSRRGVEKTLFNVTLILAVVFFLVSLASVLIKS